MSLLDERSLLLSLFLSGIFRHSFSHILLQELVALCFVVLVECHIVVADEVVALLSRRFWSLTVAIFEPCEHRLTDVNATVVDDIGLHHLIAVSLHNLRERPSEEVIAHVSEVEWLVGVR